MYLAEGTQAMITICLTGISQTKCRDLWDTMYLLAKTKSDDFSDIIDIIKILGRYAKYMLINGDIYYNGNEGY